MNGDLDNISVSTDTPSFFAYNVALTDCPQYTTYTQLYDNFRVLAAKLYFFPEYTVSYPTSDVIPTMYLVFDPDAGMPVASTQALMQYPKCKQRLFNKMRTIYFKPFAAFTASAFNGATGTTVGALVPRKTWLNTAQAGILYHGVLGAISASSTTQIPQMLVRVQVTLYTQFRSVI